MADLMSEIACLLSSIGPPFGILMKDPSTDDKHNPVAISDIAKKDS